MSLRRFGSLAWSCGLWATAALGQGPPPLGEEFQVNTYTTDSQHRCAVAVDPAGNSIVVWQDSFDHDGSLSGIFGQRLDVNGKRLGTEFQVNTYTTNSQLEPHVAADVEGNFLVVWSSYDQDGWGWGVFGQRYDAAGNPRGDEFQVNQYTGGPQSHAAVAALPDSDFLVVWASFSNDRTGDEEPRGIPPAEIDIVGQRYDVSGRPVGEQFQVNDFTTGRQSFPSVAGDAAGNFVVVWDSYPYTYSPIQVFGRRFNAHGVPLADEFPVSENTDYQVSPSVAANSEGAFTVVWNGTIEGGASWDILGQRYDPEGNPVGDIFQVNTTATGDQLGAGVDTDSAGFLVAVWGSEAQDGDDWGIVGRRFDPSGVPIGGEFVINTYATGAQSQPAVAVDSSGEFIVAWQSYGQDGDGSGVFGQRYGASLIFTDGFESGDTAAWDQTVP